MTLNVVSCMGSHNSESGMLLWRSGTTTTTTTVVRPFVRYYPGESVPASAEPYASYLHFAPEDNHTSNGQIFTGWMLFLTPNQQRQSTEGCCGGVEMLQIQFLVFYFMS